MRESRQSRVPDPQVTPSGPTFQTRGLVSQNSAKDKTWSDLRTATNLRVTDQKKLVRRSGYSAALPGTYQTVYAKASGTTGFGINSGTVYWFQDPPHVASPVVIGAVPASSEPYYWAELETGVAFGSGHLAWLIRDDLQVVPLVVPTPSGLTISPLGSLQPYANAPYAPHTGTLVGVATVSAVAAYVTADGREGPTSSIETLTVPASDAALLSSVRLSAPTPPVGFAATRFFCTSVGGHALYQVGEVPRSNTPTVEVTADVRTEVLYRAQPIGLVRQPCPTPINNMTTFGGRLYVCSWIDTASVVAYSDPMTYHLFDLTRNYFMLPIEAGLLLGTSSSIHLWTGEELKSVADFGTVPGRCGDIVTPGKALLWTTRGLYSAMPFEPVAPHFGEDPGGLVYAKTIRRDGEIGFLSSVIQEGVLTGVNVRT
jgi:hypothetical protein